MIATDILLTVLLLLFGLPALACCAYLLALTLLSSRLPRPAASSRRLKFDVIVPAHDEELVIQRVVSSLLKLDWPADRFRVVVIADNCTDATAAIARATGAEVLERQDSQRRGKGYALMFAFDRSLERGFADAVVVIDADSRAEPNLLEAFAARIEGGAQAMQADGAVLDPMLAMRTRLMAIALGAFHRLRSRARERLGLSSGIRGNGWCVTHDLLRRMPYRAFTLAEDVEYGIDIALIGTRVCYADEATVFAEMVPTARDSVKQRQRWEFGRIDLRRSRTRPLLRAAWQRRSALCLDLAIDLIVPPLSYVTILVTLFLLTAAIAVHFGTGFHEWPLWWACSAALSLVLYVLRGWQLSGVGLRGLLDLAWAPAFIVWKIALMISRHHPKEWIRTVRIRK